MFRTPLIPDVFARAFAALPDVPLWQWADDHVWLEGNEAAEPGPYRSAKTPWTRRLQELWQHPVMHVWDWAVLRWVLVPLKELHAMKSSQSGFTEAILNGIRFDACHRPKNVIYTIDTDKKAREIATRLESSLRKLDQHDVFTGDDDDVGTLVLRLRGMNVWFQGSFAMGNFSSNMAPRTVSDEAEEQGTDRTDTSAGTALKSRRKTADDGFSFSLCKPKRKRGPIHRGYLSGNQEAYTVCCPHCHYRQPVTFFRNEDQPDPIETPFSEEYLDPQTFDSSICENLSGGVEVDTQGTPESLAGPCNGRTVMRAAVEPDRGQWLRGNNAPPAQVLLPKPLPRGQTRKLVTGRIVFDHCRDLLGKWDELRILRETHYECGSCRQAIPESAKPQLLQTAAWIPTSMNGVGIVSQHTNDLLSTDQNSTWGQIVLDYLKATREGRKELQGFFNHTLGLPWSDEVNKTTEQDIRDNICGKTLYRLDAPDDSGQMQRKIFTRLEPAEAAVAACTLRGVPAQLQPSTCPIYRKGEVPVPGSVLYLGSDVGLNYAKWAVVAHLNHEDIAVIDWGTELDPGSITELILRQTWQCPANGKPYRLQFGWIDAKYRKGDVLAACLPTQRRLMPAAGLGGNAARGHKIFAATQVPQMPPGFLQLTFSDREAKDEYYIHRLKKKKRRVFFPLDVDQDPEFLAENSAEELIEDEHGRTIWNPHPGPNHYGDCVKLALTGIHYAARKVAVRPS